MEAAGISKDKKTRMVVMIRKPECQMLRDSEVTISSEDPEEAVAAMKKIVSELRETK